MWLSCTGKVYILILCVSIIVTIITIVGTFLGTLSLNKCRTVEDYLMFGWFVTALMTDNFILHLRYAQRDSTVIIAMHLWFSTRIAPVPQVSIAQMALHMHLSSHVLWGHSAMSLVYLMSLNVVHALVVITVMNWGRQPSPRNVIKVGTYFHKRIINTNKKLNQILKNNANVLAQCLHVASLSSSHL